MLLDFLRDANGRASDQRQPSLELASRRERYAICRRGCDEH